MSELIVDSTAYPEVLGTIGDELKDLLSSANCPTPDEWRRIEVLYLKWWNDSYQHIKNNGCEHRWIGDKNPDIPTSVRKNVEYPYGYGENQISLEGQIRHNNIVPIERAKRPDRWLEENVHICKCIKCGSRKVVTKSHPLSSFVARLLIFSLVSLPTMLIVGMMGW